MLKVDKIKFLCMLRIGEEMEIEHELFELYFIKGDSEFMYGKGTKEHIADLLNDWIGVHGIYEHDSVTFRVDRKTYTTKCF